jgi:dTDP-4-amino-4,6-dideoxygalactose transaminase
MYYLLLPDLAERTHFIEKMKEQGVGAVFHYIPLHSSPAGRRFGRAAAPTLPVTDHVSDCLVRMPLWIGLEDHMNEVKGIAAAALSNDGETPQRCPEAHAE